MAFERRVVCAAIRNVRGDIVCGARHLDTVMRNQIQDLFGWENHSDAVQGFIDQRGEFLTREQAWPIAEAAGQIIRRCGGDGIKLFSENLY